MKKLLDYLYSKSNKKKLQDAELADLRLYIDRRAEESRASVKIISDLRVVNYNLQMFIEDNVSKEKKDKFFKV